MTNIKLLDGIRGLAVLIVFISHSGFPQIFPGGFGVTIFFFLSGYLITTLLRREYEDCRNISLKNFYARRALKILPPLFIVLFSASIFSYFNSADIKLVGILSQVFHFANYYSIIYGDDHFPIGTAVLWSLAVEEHFYLLFPPIFLILLKRFASYKVIAIFFISLCILTLFWRLILVFGYGVSEIYTYRATDSRFDSLIWGCLLGVVFNPVMDPEKLIKSDIGEYSVLLFSFLLMFYCFFNRDPFFRETYRYSLQGGALFGLFYLALKNNSWLIFRWLDNSIISFVGKISYEIYLSHLLILFIFNKIFHDYFIFHVFISAIATLFFSTLIYFFVGKRVAVLKEKFHRFN